MTAVLALATGDMADGVIEAINALDEDALNGFGAWQPLADLSSRTRFEAVDGDPDSVVVDQTGRFQAIASVYVMLVYGPIRDEETMSDEYVATVHGHTGPDGVVIDTVEVDTMPFYE